MRKIEQDMLRAIRNNENRVLGNTYVNPVIGAVQVWLHGNHIADVTDSGVVVNVGTLRRWPTRTTLSRLRALGVDVRVRNHVVYLDGRWYEHG